MLAREDIRHHYGSVGAVCDVTCAGKAKLARSPHEVIRMLAHHMRLSGCSLTLGLSGCRSPHEVIRMLAHHMRNDIASDVTEVKFTHQVSVVPNTCMTGQMQVLDNCTTVEHKAGSLQERYRLRCDRGEVHTPGDRGAQHV
ncbi:hypothetical protein J6590_073158 [Homalodisca vitripennis]|nr:hypothetical protein J6590_073158 [Homalodisca vitripennis]